MCSGEEVVVAKWTINVASKSDIEVHSAESPR